MGDHLDTFSELSENWDQLVIIQDKEAGQSAGNCWSSVSRCSLMLTQLLPPPTVTVNMTVNGQKKCCMNFLKLSICILFQKFFFKVSVKVLGHGSSKVTQTKQIDFFKDSNKSWFLSELTFIFFFSYNSNDGY